MLNLSSHPIARWFMMLWQWGKQSSESLNIYWRDCTVHTTLSHNRMRSSLWALFSCGPRTLYYLGTMWESYSFLLNHWVAYHLHKAASNMDIPFGTLMNSRRWQCPLSYFMCLLCYIGFWVTSKFTKEQSKLSKLMLPWENIPFAKVHMYNFVLILNLVENNMLFVTELSQIKQKIKNLVVKENCGKPPLSVRNHQAVSANCNPTW